MDIRKSTNGLDIDIIVQKPKVICDSDTCNGFDVIKCKNYRPLTDKDIIR